MMLEQGSSPEQSRNCLVYDLNLLEMFKSSFLVLHESRSKRLSVGEYASLQNKG
jgi:hypothetical protein